MVLKKLRCALHRDGSLIDHSVCCRLCVVGRLSTNFYVRVSF